MRKKNAQLTGAQIVAEVLLEQGVTDVFGYPGKTVLDLYDELYLRRHQIRHILAAHEQGAAHAADGYARATGKVGVVLATSGPGATNLVTGIATAMIDSVPMVALTGNVSTSDIGRDSFQEINIYGITMPITKHNYFVTDVRELADTIREAFQIATSGRPGPVLIDIPKDVQLAKCAFTPQCPLAPEKPKAVSADSIARAAALIAEAERPYIFVGGGAATGNLTQDILSLADKIDACVGCTLMGLSAVPHRCDRFLGMQGMHGHYASTMANRKADLILALGTRFSDRATGNSKSYAQNTKIIQLDADLSEINKNVPVTLGLVGDLADTFRRLADACAPATHPAWQSEIAALRAKERALCDAAPQTDGGLSPARIFDVINAEKSDDTLIVTDVGQHQMWTAQYIDLEKPRRFISSGGLGTMGYGMGAAIGAQIGDKHRAILLTGDGSFGMNLNELATAVTYQIPLVIVLFNNGALGMVRQLQTMFYDRRYAETELSRKTDFVKLAHAFGAAGERAGTLDAFREALRTALRHDGPTLIELPIPKEEPVLPMLLSDGATDELITNQEDFQ